MKSVLSHKRACAYIQEVEDAAKTQPLPCRFWVPVFGFTPEDFLAVLRYWMNLGYTVYDWSEREITLQDTVVDVMDRCDINADPLESAGGATIFIPFPLLVNGKPIMPNKNNPTHQSKSKARYK